MNRLAPPPKSPAVAQRSDGGIRTPLSPLWLRRGAQDLADQGWRLFEPKASLARPRQIRAPQVPPRESAGAQTVGAISLGYLSCSHKKGNSPAGAKTGQQRQPTLTTSDQDKPYFKFPDKNCPNLSSARLACDSNTVLGPAP